MRVFEILLPKGASDRSLSPQVQHKIDMLQQRMNGYVDKIMGPGVSPQGKEFLKSRLRDDYYELKDLLPRTHEVAENQPPERKTQYEIFDRETNQPVPGIKPIEGVLRATQALNDLLQKGHNKYQFGYRPIRNNVMEAVHKIPITNDDFDGIKEMMNRPIPAAVARIFIENFIDDDEFNGELNILEDTEPNRDVRPLIADWVKRVMPDQLFHFTGEDEKPDLNFQRGILSPIHGYDPKMYKGTNPPITGDAYGRL